MKRGSRLNREIDRLVGIPLVVVSGLFRRKRLPAPSPRRIALFSATALGDTFLLAGITRDIRIQMPESEIIMLCGETSRGAGELLPDVDEVLTIPITKPRESLRRLGEMPSFDILIDFAPWARLPALYTAVSNATWTAGFKTSNQHRHFAYDVTVEHSDKIHELDNYRNLAKAAGFPSSSAPLLDITAEQLGEEFSGHSKIIVFHPWASGNFSVLREWAADRWIELARKLSDGVDCLFLITGGPLISKKPTVFGNNWFPPVCRQPV